MISSLWSLCQTCPSVAAAKKHQMDQRGNYRWYEYRDVSTNVIDQAPQLSGQSLKPADFRIQKDNASEVLSGVHDLMEPTLTSSSLKHNNIAQLQVLRRTQSEGPSSYPLARGSRFNVETGLMAAWVGRRRHVTDQQRPDHWLPVAAASAVSVRENTPSIKASIQGKNPKTISTSEYQKQFAWPSNAAANRRMPESVETTQCLPPTVEREAAGLVRDNGHYRMLDIRASDGGDQNADIDHPRRRRYKTEYRKKFRPFSLYQYVDGHFQEGAKSGQEQQQQMQMQTHLQTSDKDTWYREVIELRKKAGEYKFRGLGGELMPQHMMDLYAKQFDVWEQVSRRSTLSALSLAATTPRALNKADKESKTVTRKSSPVKVAPVASQRPGHAQQQQLLPARKPTNIRKVGNESERPRRDVSQQRSYSAEGKSRVKSSKPIKSPVHSSAAGAGNVTLNIRPSLGGIFHAGKPAGRSVSAGPEGRAQKSASSTGGSNGKNTPIKARPAHTESKNQASNNNQANKNKTNKDKAPSRAGSKEDSAAKENVAAEANVCPAVVVEPQQEVEEPLIKSLAEPTRVKSPEQIVVRSPDSVNWTVPLETNKTFTVTQNIRDGEGSRPHSVLSELKVSMTVRPVGNGVGGDDSTDCGGPIVVKVASSTAAPGNEENVDKSPTTATAAPVHSPKEEIIHDPLSIAICQMKTDSALPAPIPAIPDPVPASAPEPAAVAAAPLKVTAATPLLAAAIPIPVAEAPLPVPAAAPVPAPVKVNAARIRCLEDPLYMFSNPTPSAGAMKGTSAEPVAPVAPKGPRYRVLEAPSDEMNVSPTSLALSTSATSSPYKVLEAPSSPTLSSPTSANRTLASDVLEKARTRFDRFWTKKECDK